MASNNKNYYVTSPIGSDYEGVTDEAINRGVDFSKRTHRMLSASGDNENRYDGGSTGFKYLEGTLFSTKNVKFLDSDPSMLDTDFIKSVKDKDGCVYNVLRFDRSYNIRAFDFIITYTQLSDWEAKVYKSIPVTRQFKGSLLFTGCSIIRDTETMEELPLKLYAKYESIGDTVGENVDLDCKLDTKGGPALTLSYTYDSDYIYVYISSISPFRLIPSSDGEFKDVSYIENTGSLVGESKPDVQVIKDPSTGVMKTQPFARNNTIWCDVSIALRDQTTTHTNADTHPKPFEDKLLEDSYQLKTTSFVLAPTNDGEQKVIGMAPDSDVSLEIAQETKPIRFGSRLLSVDMPKIKNYVEKLSEKIKTASINTEKTPFIIKTVIRTRGKYNIKGEYFIDDQADSFGSILIQDVGTYDVLTDTFDITEYITDKTTLQTYNAGNVKNYRKYINNASDYLSEISDGKTYKHVRKVNKLLEVLTNINFESPNTLDVYSDIAYVRSPVTFEVVSAFAEFGDNDEINDDDRIVYFCKDGKIRVCGFKDYDMNDVVVYDLFGDYLNVDLANKTHVVKVDRAFVNNHYVYCIGTNNGIYALVEGIVEGELSTEIKDAFIEDAVFGEYSSGEEVTCLKSDNEYFYIGGSDGSIRIINVDNLKSACPVLHFAYGDPIRYAELISEDTVLFISENEACTYNLISGKWNYEGDPYRLKAKFLNPYGSLENPNKDLIIDKDGWEDVPTIQVGQFVYAFGLRSDTSGYAPIFKCLNTFDGSVESVDLPPKDYQTFKPKLCKENNFIYVIGGTSADDPSPTNPEDLKTKVSKFDTTLNKWVSHNTVLVEKDGEYRSFVSPNFHPIVKDSKAYLIRPRVYHFVQNEITGVYSSEEITDSGMYVIDLNNFTSAHVDLDLPEEIANQQSINVVPGLISGNTITFIAGLKNVEYDTSREINAFKGYDLYRIRVDVSDMSVTHTVQLISSKELEATYASDAASARTDMMYTYSMYTEYNEAIVYALDCKAIIYLRLDVDYSEVHMAYHSVKDSTYDPCFTQGEFVAWNNNNKLPGKVSMVHIGNYLVFIGGSSDRVNGYLDLSTISWIPSPSYSPRVITNPDSAILNNSSEAISIVSTKENVVNQVSSCKIGNTIYLLAVKLNPYKANLYKYDLDDPTKKIYFVKDLTNILVSSEYTNGFSNFTLTPLGTDIILFAPYIGYTDSGMPDKPVRKFNVFGYKISTRDTMHTVNDYTLLEDEVGKIIYALEGENKVIYTVKDGTSLCITETGLENDITNYFGNINVPYEEEDPECIIPTVRRGKFAIAAVPYKEAIVLHKFDTYNGSESVKDDSFLYTIDHSSGYKHPQLFLNGNDLYLTKGYRKGICEGSANNEYSTEIIKLKFSEAAGLAKGTDNDRQHALVSVATSGIHAPYAISRNDEIVVFGEANVDLKNGTELNNVNTRLVPIISKITESTFVSIDTYVTLTGAQRSTINRYKPYIKTIHANGHELALVFGGHASPETQVTRVMDVYDTARHIWSRICDLPEFLSNVSLKDNVILGGTIEILKDGTQKPFTRRLEIVCKDYDTLSFEVKMTDRPAADYPTYGVWCEDKDVTFVIPTTENKDTVEESIIKIVGETVTKIDPIDSKVVYNGNYKIIGSMIIGGNLVIVLFNNKTFEISFWKNFNGMWSKVTCVTEPNGIDITEKAYAFDISDEDYIAISNGEVFNAKAVISYVDPSTVNSKGVLISYVKVSDNGSITVTVPETFANIPGDDLSSVDSVEVSKDGFTYYSKNNVLNGEVRRIFPNNNSLGFGCRRLEIRDQSGKEVAVRSIKDNVLLTIYKDNTVSEIDLFTDEAVDKGTLGVDGEVIYCKQINDKLYVITKTEKFYEFKSDNLDTPVRSHDVVGVENPSILRDSEKDEFVLVINKELVDSKLTVKYANVGKNTFDILTAEIDGIESENYILFTEKLDVIYKEIASSKTVIKTSDGRVYNEFEIPSDVKLDRFDCGLIIGVDCSGKVYEIVVNDYRVVHKGYSYLTTTFTDSKLPENAIIRNSDIVLVENGYRYIHPESIDFNHYCYDNIAIEHDINTSYEDKVVSIGVNNEDSESFVVYTSEKSTHLVETRKVVVDSEGKTIKLSIGGKTSMFVDKIDDVLHLYIADPSKGTIHDINTYTGKTVVDTISELKGDGSINVIKNKSKDNSYVLHMRGDFVLYDSSTDEYEVKHFDLPNGEVVSHILKIDPYFSKLRVLHSNDSDETFSYSVIDGTHLNILSTKNTEISTDYNKIEFYNTDSIVLMNDKSSTVEVEISEDGSKVEIIKFIPDFYRDVETVSDKPLMKFSYDKSNTISYGFKIDDVVFRENDFAIKSNIITSIKIDGTINNVLKYKDYYLVVTEDNKLIVCDFDSNETFEFTENAEYLKKENTVAVANIDLYRDEMVGVSHFAQIISSNGTELKLLSFDSETDIQDIDFNVCKLVAIDITDIVESYNLDLNSVAINTNSNTITFIPRNNTASTGTFVLSSSYGTPTVHVENNVNCGDDYLIFIVADKTFVVNRDTWTCTVICTGINGVRKVVSNSDKEFEIELSKREIASLKRIPSGVYYAGNDRTCVVGSENIYFNPIKSVSEYNSRFIGVSSIGEVYDASVPISEYEISAVGVTEITGVTTRSEGNVMAIVYIVSKSDKHNVVAHIPIVTRLNTAKFVKDYDTTEDQYTGNIYAFLPSSLNGSLTRDDTSYYTGTNVVSIINSKTVNILVDNSWYSFSSLDDTLPFDSDILPIVMAYGTRTASDGSVESRYYSFVNKSGNVSTFDKELKTFVDVDGNVSVKVPFFSSNAFILPSVAKERNSKAVEVWAYTDRNPYIDTPTENLTASFAKTNNDLLK